MKSYTRAQRVSIKIQSSISEIIRKKTNDPRLLATTITGVKMSKDLRDAYVYFSVYGTDKVKKDALKGFQSATGFFRTRLAKELGMKFMPKLKFIFDESIDYGAHINKVLKDLDIKEQDETDS